MNEKNLEFKLIQNFRCKRCGCTTYDKNIYTGLKTLDEKYSILFEKYICRNCDFPFNIDEYVSNNESYVMNSKELLNSANIINENLNKGDK